MKKFAYGPSVTDQSSFITKIVTELATRWVSNREPVATMLADVQSRFPNLTPEDIYTILAELQMMNIDVSPNEWIFNLPPEYRTSVLSNTFKIANVIGSREIDVKNCIKKLEDRIKEVKEWISKNETVARLSPLVYENKLRELEGLGVQLNFLKEYKKLINSSVLFGSVKDPTHKIYVLGAVPDRQKVVAYILNTKDIVEADISELEIKTAMEEMIDKDTKDLFLDFKTLCLSGDPLKSLFEMYISSNAGEPSTKEYLEQYITDFLDYISDNSSSFGFSPEEINDAYKQIKDFIKANGLNVEVDKYIDKSIKAPNEEKESEEKESEEKESEEKESEEARTASFKDNIKMADVLKEYQTLKDILLGFKTKDGIEKTAAFIDAVDNTLDFLNDIEHIIKNKLPYEPENEKKAAYIVLRNMANELKEIEGKYNGILNKDVIPILFAQDVINILKNGSIKLTII